MDGEPGGPGKSKKEFQINSLCCITILSEGDIKTKKDIFEAGCFRIAASDFLIKIH